ncbi:MGMT family protein [Streptomyces sp. H27-D2]|uniref:MGMT family protein n=1 Tax=Streptomyces sp. H27-D2 TaxID=3046304 RepID=UPI002DB955C9|nr:MGMT family protein [Streptomyces sp. H27-D2]MEC4018347.1 MGMT family protein [Streptomyces sp. H27-D2]
MSRQSSPGAPEGGDDGATGTASGHAEAAGIDDGDALPAYAERVLSVTEGIPPGRVMTYGDVAEWLGEGGPRQVGRVMALYGGPVPWWRVVRSDGALLPGHELRALDHYRREGTPLREAARSARGHEPRIDMRRARWDGGAADGPNPGHASGSGGGEPGSGPGGGRGDDGGGRCVGDLEAPHN